MATAHRLARRLGIRRVNSKKAGEGRRMGPTSMGRALPAAMGDGTVPGERGAGRAS